MFFRRFKYENMLFPFNKKSTENRMKSSKNVLKKPIKRFITYGLVYTIAVISFSKCLAKKPNIEDNQSMAKSNAKIFYIERAYLNTPWTSIFSRPIN